MNLIKYFFILISFISYSQYCPYLGPDQYLPCGSTSTTLTADFSQCAVGSNPNQTTNYGVSNIPYIPQTNTGTQLFMSDDSQQGPFNIGFTFCFFGQTYTQFWVGSNGWISFSPAQPTTFTSATIPATAATIPKNCIMGPWQDWHPGVGGQIRYQVQGTAPCRRLVVSWINMPMFSCTSTLGTFHIVIYESTNYIENHIQVKPNCLAWAGGTAVQGIHNTAGTTAITVPGRNSTQWVTNNDAWRYTPSGPTVLPTPTWYQVGNPNPIGIGNTINVTPPSAGASYTCQLVYPTCNVGWNSCNSIVGPGPDTVFVQPGPPNLLPLTVNFTNPTCFQSCDGTIDILTNNGQAPFSYVWNSGQNLPNLIDLCAGVYNVIVTDALGCNVITNVTLTDPIPFIINPINGIEPDTICFNSPNNLFDVTDLNPSPIYVWSNAIGSVNNTQGNEIDLNFTNVSGGLYNDAISVYGVNGNGCQSQTETFDVYILDINPTIDTILPMCEYNDCVTLIGSPLGGVFTGPNVSNNQYCPDSTIVGINTITYTYTEANCVFDTYTSNIIYPRPVINGVYNNMGAEGYQFNEICEGDILTNTYNTITTGGLNTWYVFGDTVQSQNLILEWTGNGSYTFYVTTEENGCVSYPAYFDVALSQCPQELIFIPNTFTPDGDEFNQSWLPIFTEGFDPYDYNLLVFNRWGETVFESNNHQIGWLGDYKGKECMEGTYTWRIEFGNLVNDARKVITGHLTLTR